MGKTALDLTREEWQAYQPGTKVGQDQPRERWERAWRVAQTAAEVLRQQFGATRVVAFGSLARRDWFTPWSDIDLAAWGISPGAFYRAVAVVTGISSEFRLDLVATEDCQPSLQHVIEREGVAL
jgi:predicted nucleotidyltransferase